MSNSSERESSVQEVTRLIAALLSLVYAVWMIWMIIPEHRKRLFLMRLSQVIQSGASWTACRIGELAIQEEARSGVRNYYLVYGVSLVREQAATAYERLRYTA